MWNIEGKNILVALTELCKAHEADIAAASEELTKRIPSQTEIRLLVVRLCGVREQLHRCGSIRDELSLARMDKKSLEDVLHAAIDKLAAEAQTRHAALLAGDFAYNEGAEYIEKVSLKSLEALRERLSQFKNVPPADL